METIYIPNTQIYLETNLSLSQFLSKVKHVRQIRTNDEPLFFSLYPVDQAELDQNYKIWQYANGDFNVLNNDFAKVFVVKFPKSLYLFLRYSSYEQVMKSIILALTGFYASISVNKKEMEHQLHPEIMKAVKKYHKDNFREFEVQEIIRNDKAKTEDIFNPEHYIIPDPFNEHFDSFYKINGGSPELIPFIYPEHDFRFRPSGPTSFGGEFNGRIEYSYFTNKDWERIILRGIKDDLKRAESLEKPWKAWIERINPEGRPL
ncbi:hypothetical protein [Flexithrix dorotheae]|uniref:hypothetical protein n=1 Tax=Flexithrix dorotheae TaxID=70993 RepID=UPI00037733FA|nr:hypothetical protein [Flexithrix dorotheae]